MSDDLKDVEKSMLEGLVRGKKSAKKAKQTKIDKPNLLQEKLEADVMRETAAEAAEEPAVTEYTVASGDTLSAIAQKHYGSQVNWKKIYEANKETIGDNPSLIRAGQVLTIPDLD
jgi:nucleoid-associated protein YgaU